MTSIILS